MNKIQMHGKVQNCRLDLIDREALKRALTFYHGKEVILTIEEKKKARSGAQNRYYWGVVVATIANETGNDPETIHEALKLKFLAKQNLVIGNDELVLLTSTTKLNTNEFNEYVEKIAAWCAEIGIVIPFPNESF